MEDIRFLSAGDSALLLEFENKISPEISRKVIDIMHLIDRQHVEGIIEMIPAYRTLLIIFEPRVISAETIEKRVRDLKRQKPMHRQEGHKMLRIPVCYGGEYGPDLKAAAQYTGLAEEEIIRLHTEVPYRIYMIGFLPGFPYLGGLDSRLFVPRLENPRLKVPAGSVGIGGEQTGIYPMESPGGWNIIGRTPIRLFAPEREPAVLYEAGDTICFYPVDEEEYERIRQKEEAAL